MPQLNKGGKFVYGFSEIHIDGTVHFPDLAVSKYGIANEGNIIIFTGSKMTGGFCVTTKQLLSQSKLSHILSECSGLSSYTIDSGEFVRYKGRSYSWLPILPSGTIKLSKDAMNYLHLNVGDKLMCIKSSNIAFTMGATGILMDRAKQYNGNIDLY